MNKLVNALVILSALATAVLLCLSLNAAEATIVFDAPTVNTDGTQLTDLTGYKLEAVKLQVAAVIVSNRVQSLAFTAGPTSTYSVASSTNAPVAGTVETNKLTMPAGWYVFRGRSVCGDRESTNCSAITNRVGTPTSIGVVIAR